MQNFKKLFPVLMATTIISLHVLFVSCDKEEIEKPVIESFTPETGLAAGQGAEGSVVIITGSNFSSDSKDNAVTFNGIVATITESSTAQITTTVPQGATTGKIAVAVKGHSVSSANDFTVILPPTISSFSPKHGGKGTVVTISGKNFSSVLAENTVFINQVSAAVLTASATQLTVSIPDSAVTGKIRIKVNGLSVLTSDNFSIPLGPVITSFSPIFGAPGDEVIITGSNFAVANGENEVSFNGVSASVVSASATQIKVSVPAAATSGKITVAYNEFSTTSADDFIILHDPVITSFTPEEGPVGTTVTITGSHFSTVQGDNEIKFNGVSATVLDASETQLTARVPLGATTGKIEVTVEGLATTFSDNDFNVLPTPPTITGFTPTSGLPPAINTGLPGTTVIINGFDFHTTVGGNIVEFNNTTATVTAASATQLTVVVPLGATTGKIKVTTNGATVETVNDFIVGERNKWVKSANFPGAARRHASSFTMGTKLYIGLGLSSSGTLLKDFWEYDTEANIWTQKADFPGARRFQAVGLSIGTRGYFGCGTGDGGVRLADFWQYNPLTDQWTQKASFPEGRQLAVFFAVGTKGYVGGGMANGVAVIRKDFWEYDPQVNVWTQKQDMLSERYDAGSFVIGSKGYLYGGAASNGVLKSLNEYDPLTNSWSSKADYPYASAQGEMFTGFTIASKGFAGRSTTFAMYNPETNEWTAKSNFPVQLVYNEGEGIGNVGYVAFGETGITTTTTIFYKYIPD